MVLEIRIADKVVLHMGDFGHAAEATLLGNEVLPGSVDILIAGHHGSADTSSHQLLAHVSPEYTVVSTNRNNLRGYPDLNTIRRLRHHSERLLRTWIEGEICLRLPSAGDITRC